VDAVAAPGEDHGQRHHAHAEEQVQDEKLLTSRALNCEADGLYFQGLTVCWGLLTTL